MAGSKIWRRELRGEGRPCRAASAHCGPITEVWTLGWRSQRGPWWEVRKSGAGSWEPFVHFHTKEGPAKSEKLRIYMVIARPRVRGRLLLAVYCGEVWSMAERPPNPPMPGWIALVDYLRFFFWVQKFISFVYGWFCCQMPGFTNNWPEVDIQRNDAITSSSDTQTLSGQRQSGVHRSGRCCECPRGEGERLSNLQQLHFDK